MRHENFANVLRFGRFDLDLRSGELYSNGLKVQLQEQPFRILELLAERFGELVTREEIRRRLWPNGTIVEFDNAVNVAMKKLRLALGDSAEQPHYIETVKRRGYRLIVPVESRSDGMSDFGTSNDLAKEDTEASPFMPVQDLSGRKISHYQVLDLIGGGGMGVVYRAEDIRLGRQVALKFLPDELSSHPIALERLRLEARSASALNHPNICTIYEIGEDAGQPFIVMELLEGSTLRDRLSGTSLAPGVVLDYAFQIAEGLHAAHRKGIVHRDIKPANIFITTQPQEHAKILDFGLAKATTPPGRAGQLDIGGPKHLTGPGAAAGTIAYMSPEQVLGKPLDARSDLFSFGVVLYEMATGKTPFSGVTDAAIFDAILHKTPISSVRVNPDVPPGLDHIITKCLEKDRELRYRDASEIRDELQRLKRETDSARLNPSTPPAVSTLEKRWSRIAPAVAVVALVIAGGYLYLHRTPKLTDKDNIVLADFINTTGEPVFEGTLRQGLAVQLGQSPFLSLVSEDRIQRTLRLMGRPVDTRLTAELARDVCERTASAAVLEESIARLGSHYVLGLRAKNCRTGEILDEEQAQAARKEDVLDSLSQIARKFRTRIGESLVTIEQHETPLEEATTPSLEALKAYSTASKVSVSSGFRSAIPLLQRAVQIDPNFAMASAVLGTSYGSIGEPVLAGESITRANGLRNRASDHERFYIMLSYDLLATGNLERAEQIGELWAQTYPRDAVPHAFLAWINQLLGRYEKAMQEGKNAIDRDPDFVPAYNNLAWSYVFLNRFSDAEKTIQRASNRKLETPDLLIIEYYIAFLRDDKAGMERAALLGKEKSGMEDWISYEQALVLAYSGHLQQATRMSQSAMNLAQQASQAQRAALYQAGAALLNAFFGKASEAKRSAIAAVEISKARDVEYGAAFALALSGDTSRSQALANHLEKQFPEDTFVRFNYLPTLRAFFALNHSEPARAIELLQTTAPYELATPGYWFGFLGNLYPTYVRGTAYLAKRQTAEAAAEFQKILDHQSVVFGDPVSAMARLQLGRALALAGDKPKANVAYQDFLKLWKDADPDIPILKQAKAEYTKLQ